MFSFIIFKKHINNIKFKGVTVKYKGKTVLPKFLPDNNVPYEFNPFNRDELVKIQNGETEIILSKPLAYAEQAETHVIALCYVNGKRTNYISIHKGNPFTVRSIAAFLLFANWRLQLPHFNGIKSMRNGSPVNKAVSVIKLTPEKIDELIIKLAEKHD